ncbi:MAG: GntR family transcriptional regulator [Pseudomonadota bacterium]
MAKSPRYAALAAEWRRAIADGRYAVGALLPTEHALCEQHGVSRHTARAALQILESAGLIERRPGLGTIVLSAGDAVEFAQPLGGLDDLMQYAREARLEVRRTGKCTLNKADAALYRGDAGSLWLRIDGRRAAGGKPIAATSILIADALGAAENDFADGADPVTETIERRYGVSIAKIRQSIRAETVAGDDADLLEVAAGAPCLRTIRRYYDAADALFVVSDSRHPADRFVYEMSYRRQER